MPKHGRRGRGGGGKRRESAVPYAKGYRPPTEKKRLAALGKISAGAREFQSGDGFFSPLPAPTSVDDWLAQYNEEGQTYPQFISQCPWLSKRKYYKGPFEPSGRNIREKYPGTKIYLQPLGNFDGEDAPNFEDLAEYARLFFCLPVEVLPPVTVEDVDSDIYWIESADMKSRVDQKAKRKSPRSSKCRLDYRRKDGHLQLHCPSVLARLRRTLPDDALCLVGLTMLDLYADDPDLFVAGLAAGNARVAVFSFFRYDPGLSFSPEFWHQVKISQEISRAERRKAVLQRGCKLLVHELGHLLGFDHCIWFSCLMNGSGHLQEDFSQPMTLCPVDLRKLQTLTGCDTVARYTGLLAFFRRCGMDNEAEWVDRRLAYLTLS